MKEDEYLLEREILARLENIERIMARQQKEIHALKTRGFKLSMIEKRTFYGFILEWGVILMMALILGTATAYYMR